MQFHGGGPETRLNEVFVNKKKALFVFNGELMCFVHVLLNALEMKSKGYDVHVILEGLSVRLVGELEKGESPMAGLYVQAKAKGLLTAVCRACSVQLNVLENIEKSGLPLVDDMSGHVSMSHYIDQGYDVIVF